MITIGIDPVLLSFGHLGVRWYGLIVALALGAGLWVSNREAARRGLDEQEFGSMVSWAILFGAIGARAFHVIDHWADEYALNPISALYVWEGGLAIWGAVIGGLLAVVVWSYRRKLHAGLLLDTVVPGLVLGQAIGRLACVITGDAVGKPTSGPLGLAYTNPGAMVPELGVYYTPTPVYEFLMNLAIFAVLWRLRRRSLPTGGLFLVYLVLYSVGRFAITFWSAYQTVAFGLNQAQIISLAALAVGVPWLVLLLRQSARRRSAATI